MERAAEIAVAGKSFGPRDIFIGGKCDALVQADRAEQGQPIATEQTPTDQGDDRYAHPHGLASCGHPAIGRGVEGHVDFVIEREITEQIGRPASQLYSRGVDARGRKAIHIKPPRRRIAKSLGFEQ